MATNSFHEASVKALDVSWDWLHAFCPTPLKPWAFATLAVGSYVVAVQILMRRGIDTHKTLKISTSFSSIKYLFGFMFLMYPILFLIEYLFQSKIVEAPTKPIHDSIANFYAITLLIEFAFLLFPWQLFGFHASKNFLLASLEIVFGRWKVWKVPFKLVLLADIFTSYAGILSETVKIFLKDREKNVFHCLVPTIPFLFRFRQCISEFIGTKHPKHLINALKYVMSMYTTYILEAFTKEWRAAMTPIEMWSMIGLFVFGCLISLVWDIRMDWNMGLGNFLPYGPSKSPVSSPDIIVTAPIEASDLEEGRQVDVSANAGQQTPNSPSSSSTHMFLPDKGDKQGRFSVAFYVYVFLFNLLGRSFVVFRILIKLFREEGDFSTKFFFTAWKSNIFFTFFEGYRRFNWILLRVENYHSLQMFLEGNK